MTRPRQRGARARDREAAGDGVARDRLLHVDNCKVVLTAAVIVAHAAMTYGAAGTWVYEESSLADPTEAVLSAVVGAGVLFGLGLFFLIAGLLTSGPLARRGPRRFLVARLARLGLPVVAYAAVVWPLLRWTVDRVEGDHRALTAFYRRQFSGRAFWSAGTGPLWFVLVLLAVTVGWTLWRWVHPAGGRRLLRSADLFVAAVFVAVATFFVRIAFPIDSPQFLDAHVWLWPQAIALFALGAMGAERGWFVALDDAVRRACRRAVLASLAALVVFVLLSDGPDPFKGGWHWEAAAFASCEGLFSVGTSVLLLEWFRRNRATQGPLGRVLAGASYGAFVAQGPVLVALALALRSVDVAGEIKLLVVAPAAVGLSFALGAIARRGTARRRS